MRMSVPDETNFPSSSESKNTVATVTIQTPCDCSPTQTSDTPRSHQHGVSCNSCNFSSLSISPSHMLHEPLCAKDLGLQPDDLHVFVLSDAGKPIYSRYGDETKLAHLMGVMQALVSVASQDGDELRTIITEERKIVFRTCGHLILVAVGPQIAPTGHLTTVLKYVYNQIVSALTVQRIEKWFTQKHNLDLRNLLIGDSRILSGAIEQVETQLGPTLNAVLCIPLSVSVRDTVVQAITQPIKSQVSRHPFGRLNKYYLL
uniref:Vacuolar fusion protein MON1 homolog n=1 Tax=Schistocephalus solidus TaxID=70667 RepID=A0A0X3NUJ5_SCHSO